MSIYRKWSRLFRAFCERKKFLNDMTTEQIRDRLIMKIIVMRIIRKAGVVTRWSIVLSLTLAACIWRGPVYGFLIFIGADIAITMLAATYLMSKGRTIWEVFSDDDD